MRTYHSHAAWPLFLLVTACAHDPIAAPSPQPPNGVSAPSAFPGVRTTVYVDRAGSDIFPESWTTPRINAQADPLDPEVAASARALVARAFAKYPPAILNENLESVYVVGKLGYSGITAGGTNSRSVVYLADTKRYSPIDVEGIFHAEFSSILLRNFPTYFDKARWIQINPEDFRYRGEGGVDAIKDNLASTRADEALHERGFINQYGTADLEDDFNSFAERLFMGDAKFWQAYEKYPRVKAKAELAMQFYASLDAKLDSAFFASLRQQKTRQ